jgi:hypothetical protein
MAICSASTWPPDVTVALDRRLLDVLARQASEVDVSLGDEP